MMHVLLTGAAGFVGWKTAQLLLRDGHTVTGLDNFLDLYPVGLKRWRRDQLTGLENFSFVEGDLGDAALLERLFSENGFDAVINLAACAGVRMSIEKPLLYVDNNVRAGTVLMEAMVKHKVGKLVLASTSSLYAGHDIPFSEDKPADRPLSPYAASKKAAETMAYTYHHLHGLDVTILRYFTVYGPAGRPDMSPLKFTHRIARGRPFPLYGDGEQRRDFTYIDDIAAGTVKGLKPLGYEIINLGGGNEPLAINRMISLLEEYLGKTALLDRHPFNEADMPETAADLTKARTLLDWESHTAPEEGFARLVEWYQANVDWLGPLLDTYEG